VKVLKLFQTMDSAQQIVRLSSSIIPNNQVFHSCELHEFH